MAFNGKLIRVADQNGKWGVLIDTEEKGETWLTIWDRKFAGQDSAEHKAVCDCHDFVGERVVSRQRAGISKTRMALRRAKGGTLPSLQSRLKHPASLPTK